jgi:hypothetical protein
MPSMLGQVADLAVERTEETFFVMKYRLHMVMSPESRGGAAALVGLLERRPATVLFVTVGALLAGVVQQSLANVFPERISVRQPDGIGLLNFDGATVAAAEAGALRHPTTPAARHLSLVR